MILIIAILNSYTYKVYTKMKILYQEVFCIYPVHQMVRYEPYKKYVNEALGKNLNLHSEEMLHAFAWSGLWNKFNGNWIKIEVSYTIEKI